MTHIQTLRDCYDLFDSTGIEKTKQQDFNRSIANYNKFGEHLPDTPAQITCKKFWSLVKASSDAFKNAVLENPELGIGKKVSGTSTQHKNPASYHSYKGTLHSVKNGKAYVVFNHLIEQGKDEPRLSKEWGFAPEEIPASDELLEFIKNLKN